MDLIEAKREVNNFLFRKYHSITDNEREKEKYFKLLKYFNIDLVVFIINNEFPNNKSTYIVGVQGLEKAIYNYEMDKICSFEEFILSNIRNEIQLRIEENKKRF